ncbi:2Fe-2S ferredoxin-type domain-containing protein [Novosphingobium lubricantis]|jgi:2Fe-2S ferredoxin
MHIIFRYADSRERVVTASVGDNLLRVAQANDINGIPGDCGGQCACGTCHVYIDPVWAARIGNVEPGSTEEAMIFGAPVDARPTSRLACQIDLTAHHDGLIVDVPEGQ